MASYNHINLRKANHLDLFDNDIGKALQGLKNANYDPWIWEFLISQEAPDAAAEIYVDFTVEFNGEASGEQLYIIGQAANEDKAEGTGAQVVRIFGITYTGKPHYEDITMHATAGTQKITTVAWKRFVGGMVVQAGSGGVNAGIIQITNTGQTEVYGTIAAGENCTIGARVYVPMDYNAFIGSIKGAPLITGDTVLVYGDGVNLEPIYVKGTTTRLSTDKYWISTDQVGLKDLGIYKELVIGANTYYISFKHETKIDATNISAYYNIRIIMYGTTNTLRGLGA